MDLELDIYKNVIIDSFIHNSIDDNGNLSTNDVDKSQCIYLSTDLNESYIVDSNYVSEASVTMTEGSLEKDEDSLEYQLEDANDNGETLETIYDCHNTTENNDSMLESTEMKAEDAHDAIIIAQSDNIKVDLIKTESIDKISSDDIDEANYFDCEDSGFNDNNNHNGDDTIKSDQNSSQVSEMNSPEYRGTQILIGTDEIITIGDEYEANDAQGKQLSTLSACATNRSDRTNHIAPLLHSAESPVDSRSSSDYDIMDLNDNEFASSHWLYCADDAPSAPIADKFDIDSTFSFSTMKLATIEPNNPSALSLELNRLRNGWIYDSALSASFPDKLTNISPVRQLTNISRKNNDENNPLMTNIDANPVEFISHSSTNDLNSCSVGYIRQLESVEPMEDSLEPKTVGNIHVESEPKKAPISAIPSKSLMKRPMELSKSTLRIPSANRAAPRIGLLSPKRENDVLIRAAAAQFDSGRRHTVVEVSPKEVTNNNRARPQSMVKFGDFKAPSAIGRPMKSVRASVVGLQKSSTLSVREAESPKTKPGLKPPSNIAAPIAKNRPSKLQIPSMNPKLVAPKLANPRNPSPKTENPPPKLLNPSSKLQNPSSIPRNGPSHPKNPSPRTEHPPSKLQNPSSKLQNPSLKPKNLPIKPEIPPVEPSPVQPTQSHNSPIMSPSVPNQNSASSCDTNPLNRTFDRDEFQVLKSSFTISTSCSNNNNADSLSDASNETLHLSGGGSDTDTNGNNRNLTNRKSLLSPAPSSSKLGGIYQLAMKEEENLKKHVNSALLGPPQQPTMNYRSLKLPSKPRGIPMLRK